MKRVLYILGVFMVSLLLVLSMLVVVLTNDRVQTAIVQWVAHEFSEAVGTKAHVGAVHYHFPAKFSIHDIYLEDQHQDTLAHIDEMYVHFRPLALLDNEVVFNHAHVHKVRAKLYEHEGAWNYQFLVDAFQSEPKEEEEPSEPSTTVFSVRDIQIDSLSVQYGDYAISLPYASMDLRQITSTSLDGQINELALRVQNIADESLPPLEVQDLSAHLIRNDTVFNMPTLRAQLSQSRLDMSGIDVTFPKSGSITLEEAAHDIFYSINIREANVVPADMSVLAPQLKGLKSPVVMKGALEGRLDSLCLAGLNMQYNGRPVLDGNVCVTGLPESDKVYVNAKVKDVQTNAVRLQEFLSQLQNRTVKLPPIVHRLGNVHYTGLLKGHLRDLTLNGGFSTALGDISTDGRLVSDSDYTHVTYDMSLKGEQFRLGELLQEEKINTLTARLNTKGEIREGMLYGDINADLQQFSYNDYAFSDLHLNGEYEPQSFKGNFDFDDPHISLAFDGGVNVQDQDPKINFDLVCRHFDMSPFTDDHDPVVQTFFRMYVDLDGDKRDNLNGYVKFDSISLATAKGAAKMEEIRCEVYASSDQSKSIKLTSDPLIASVDGKFAYVDLIPALQDRLHEVLPAVIPEPKAKWAPVEMAFRANGKELQEIQSLFDAPIVVSDYPKFEADLVLAPKPTKNEKKQKNSDEVKPLVKMNIEVPGVRINSKSIDGISVSLDDSIRHYRSLSHSTDSISTLFFKVAAGMDSTKFDFSTLAYHDSLASTFKFNEKMGNRNEGDVRFITHFAQYNQQPLIELHFDSSTFVVRDSAYQLRESHIAYSAAESWLGVDSFCIEGTSQHIRVNGLATTDPKDSLTISLQQIDAAYIVPFFVPEEELSFAGRLTGQAYVTNLFAGPIVKSNMHVDSLGMNHSYLGDANVNLNILPRSEHNGIVLHPRMNFVAKVNRPDYAQGRDTIAQIVGAANFVTGTWKLDMKLDSVPMKMVNHWTADILDSLDGYGSGKLIVGGKGDETYVIMKVKADTASFVLPWTGVRYTLKDDSIKTDTTSIHLPNVRLADVYGNPVEINGAIYHDMFKTFTMDLHVDAHDAMVFDSNVPGDMMQGTVFAKGHVDITGDDQDMLIQADVKTSRNSHFRYCIDNMSSAYESNFIHFVDHSKDTLVLHASRVDNKVRETGGRCLLRFNMDVTPQMLFQLVLGERSGDMIAARGNGELSLRYDTQTGNVSLQGLYDIEQGALNYTVANVIRKEFQIGSGSTIIFSGNPSNPQLDVTAKYRVTASLKDLLGEEASQVTSRPNIPVNTCMHLAGGLNNPVLNFSLEFPNTDQLVQQQVKQVINTDEMLMRQVIYLLVFNRFFAPENMGNMQDATLNSTYSLLSSTVTGQINAWLSKLTNMLTLGVAIRRDGEGADASQEYEAQFQLQPVDRLVINGNFGYRYNDISNQPFFGDLDVEVLLTEDGQWRLKGYTHTVDKYSLRQATTIQGFGILWKKDF